MVAMRAIKTTLIYTHRYLGILLSLMFVVWFVSGFFMIYTGGMPKVTPDMQVAGGEPIDFGKVTITPAKAVEIAGFDPPATVLRTIVGRPVYELGESGYNSLYLYADSGEPVPELSREQGAELAGRFLGIPATQFHYVQTLEDNTDQWTFTVRRELPLYKYVVDDDAATEVYVSQSAYKVSAYTTRKSRFFAWMGTIPHWLYFESLRDNQKLWNGIVVWSSGIGSVVALLGLCLGITQFRKVRPFQLSRAIPYRGWLRWHYIAGCLFGVVTLTWVFSGLVSMEPWEWTNRQGIRISPDALAGSDLQLSEFASAAGIRWSKLSGNPVKQVSFVRVLGKPYYIGSVATAAAEDAKRDRLHQPYNINGQLQAREIVVEASSGREHTAFPADVLASRVDEIVTDAAIIEQGLLQEYDDYYYSRGNQLPLPVVRLKFDDPEASWVYVDPARGQVLSVVHKWSRLERWLYNGLHSLDFAVWYHKRPLWDIGVLFLMTGGLCTSLLGLYLGLRRLKYDLVFLFQKFAGRKSAGATSHVS